MPWRNLFSVLTGVYVVISKVMTRAEKDSIGISFGISPIHTFVNIPALLLKNTLRFLIRAGILTKV